MTISSKADLLVKDIRLTLSTIEEHPVAAIHIIRKRIKHLKALMSFIPGPLGLTTLKSISTTLAPYRDAQVNWETYQSCISVVPQLQSTPIENALKIEPFFVDKYPDRAAIHQINKQITDFELQLAGLPLNLTKEEIVLGLKKSYHAGKKGFKRAKQDTGSDCIHAWRKKTKRLWYQLRFIYGDTHEDPHHVLNLSHSLSKTLGDLHDLDVLSASLSPLLRDSFQAHIASNRAQLLQRAFLTGHRLYSTSPTTFYETHLLSF